jgi:hypothetical protein
MAGYDVFIAAALEDIEIAKMIERRLKALKLKVFLDKDRSDNDSATGFDSKDAKAAFNSRSMLVLWSEAACNSDWIRAAASVGRARDILVQVGLDEAIPYAPFGLDIRHDLAGWKGRTVTDGWRDTVTALGGFADRPGLRSYLDLDTNDVSAYGAWSRTFEADPLSMFAEKRLFGAAAAKAGVAPTPASDKPKAAADSDRGAFGAGFTSAATAAGAAAVGAGFAGSTSYAADSYGQTTSSGHAYSYQAAAEPTAYHPDGRALGHRTQYVGSAAPVEGSGSCASVLGLWPAVAGIIALLLMAWVVASARGHYTPLNPCPAVPAATTFTA